MPSKYPETTQKTTQKIFTPNEYSQLVRRKFGESSEKSSEKGWAEKVGRKASEKVG